MSEKRKKFWMLFGENAGAPTTKHDNYLAALAEAKRLMESKNMARCYILEAVGVVEAERHLYHEEIAYDTARHPGFRDLLRQEELQLNEDDNGELHSRPAV